MTPDIEQHIALMLGTLLAIGETLRRLLKRRNRVRLALTLSVTEENSNDSLLSIGINEADGRKTDSSDAQQQREKQPRKDPQRKDK